MALHARPLAPDARNRYYVPMLAKTPEPPYWTVIFTSLRTSDNVGYGAMAESMETLARQQDGFLGLDSARDGVGITVSYWRDPAAIEAWRNNIEHRIARQLGRERWYEAYELRVAKVERAYGWTKPA
jgi:heme-degrading monooxygenase HmoA